MAKTFLEYDDLAMIKAGCNVHLAGNLICRLVEKPTEDQIEGKWCWDGSLVLDSSVFPVLRELASEAHNTKKDSICLVKAMQKLIDKKTQIAAIKKKCKNINITSDLDYLHANLMEFEKKYGEIKINSFIDKVLKNPKL